MSSPTESSPVSPAGPRVRTVRVLERRAVGRETWVLVTDGGAQLAGSRPGQFAMLRGPWGRDPILPRAFSILRHEGDHASYLVKVAGRGTRLLSLLGPGDALEVLGPLGRPFPRPSDEALGDGTRDLLVAGGVGLAPLLWYAEEAAAAGRAAHVALVYGARSAADLVLLDAIRATGVALHLATEDGSAPVGDAAAFAVTRGRVTDALAPLLDGGSAAAASTRVLACGPNPMMRAVAAQAHAAGLRCLVSLEGEMACGVGVCLGCPVPTAPALVAAGERPYRYCCTDGPVFDAAKVVVP